MGKFNSNHKNDRVRDRQFMRFIGLGALYAIGLFIVILQLRSIF